MTEEEWLGTSQPLSMLEFVRRPLNERRSRLFAVACCRNVWSLITDERSRNAVAISEQFADQDTRARSHTRMVAELDAHDAYVQARTDFDRRLAQAVHFAIQERTSLIHISILTSRANTDFEIESSRQREQANFLRDIFGNPFRPVVAEPAWLTDTVQSIASAIYQDRAFDRLPILADALEEAGCTNADVLLHCRQPGEHVRGCWVVDLVLGKE